VGLVFAEKNIEKLAEGLQRGLEDFSQFGTYRTEVLRCAETEFNAEGNRKKLHRWLETAHYED
jgi:hypothetical protein